MYLCMSVYVRCCERLCVRVCVCEKIFFGGNEGESKLVWGRRQNECKRKKKKKRCRNNLIKRYKNNDLNIKMVKLDLNKKKK